MLHSKLNPLQGSDMLGQHGEDSVDDSDEDAETYSVCVNSFSPNVIRDVLFQLVGSDLQGHFQGDLQRGQTRRRYDDQDSRSDQSASDWGF
ncbi:hypothetical protein ElyMa_003178900 [Elysia marginata]|uniref:Uncharacterized protein n=1 Tax=Elysia marginata TaxID=1093978 RepID=A0AAV4J334_9GAST|nr:hypothetical protein ElyMa_003178900 [Elysia marginata]